MRVTKYSVGIAQRLGMSQEAVDVIALGAELHDIGKIGVSEAVLNKPAKLTDAEYRHIMEHPTIGARILEPLMRDAPIALAIVRHHHERLDGKGFPDGLKADAIPLEVRVVTVADSFDAMTSVRPYRPAMSIDKAIEELQVWKGRQFDRRRWSMHWWPRSRPRRRSRWPRPRSGRCTFLPSRSIPVPPTPRLEARRPMTDTLMVGVSGVRGIVDKDLTPDIVARWARAFGRWAGERKPLVVVGRDSRPSGPRFARGRARGPHRGRVRP